VPRIHKRILFVDDEPAVRTTLALILRRYGFIVTVASTVAEALEKIKIEEFDLLLSDLNIER
jgi:CheY-like chemotaxis protein